MNQLGFTEAQVGHMTLKKWTKLYKVYQNEWDKKAIMNNRGLIYGDLNKVITLDDVIPL